MKCSDYMIGGDHYKNKRIPDHWDIAHELGWDYFTAAATKYLWRLGKKGGQEKTVQDLEKAIHYLQKKLELMKAEQEQLTAHTNQPIHVFTAGDAACDATPGYVNQDR